MAEHGTLGRYRRGCRCEACVHVNRERIRSWRRRRGVPERQQGQWGGFGTAQPTLGFSLAGKNSNRAFVEHDTMTREQYLAARS